MLQPLFALLISVVLLASTSAHAGLTDDITVHVESVSTPADVFSAIGQLPTQTEVANFDDETVILDHIINLGQKAWAVIKANEPVLNIKYNYANALPQGVRSSRSLDGFSNLQSESVRVWGTNTFGATVYDFTLSSVHQYGGSFEGKGQYLETVSVVPTDVSVMWGYTVDVTVTGISQVNHGTKANPVAGLTLEAAMKVSTVLQKQENRILYQFRGDSPTVQTVGLRR